MSIISLIKIEIDEKIKIKITHYFHMILIKVFFLFFLSKFVLYIIFVLYINKIVYNNFYNYISIIYI